MFITDGEITVSLFSQALTEYVQSVNQEHNVTVESILK